MKRRLLFVAIIAASFAIFSAQSRPAAMLSPGQCFTGTTVLPYGALPVIATITHKTGDQITVTFTGGVAITANIGDIPSSATGVSPLSHTYTSSTSGPVQLINIPPIPGPTITSHWTISLNGGCNSTNSAAGSVTTWNFTDGRINSHDGAQTAAVYCENDGGVTVYAVIDSVGYLAFKATKAEIDAVPTKPAHNTLIKSGLNVALYRLTSGALQINASDNYVFAWDGC